MPNEVFALHYKGQLVKPDIWKEFSDKYGSQRDCLYGWRIPKKIYMKIGHAKNAIRHLPKEIQEEVEIVRYTPKEDKKALEEETKVLKERIAALEPYFYWYVSKYPEAQPLDPIPEEEE